MEKQISYRNELFRKAIHLSSLWMVVAIGVLPKWYNVALFAFLLVSIVIVEYGNHSKWKLFTLLYGSLFNRILREKETQEKFRLSGAPYVVAAALMVSLLFTPVIAMTALAVMLIGDTAAALIGRKFGRHKINAGTKSVEGSLALWIVSALVVVFFFVLYAKPLSFLLFGLIGVTGATFAELYENKLCIDDNFSIPLAVGIVISIPYWISLVNSSILL